jgi:hypothetical protein
LLVTSHLTAYSLPVADCRDLDSSWHTINIASVSMNMFYYIASCSLMQGYQHFTCWLLLHRMSYLTVFWQTIISLQPLTHQGLCTRLHGFIFRKQAVILRCVHSNRFESSPIKSGQYHKDAAVTLWLTFNGRRGSAYTPGESSRV